MGWISTILSAGTAIAATGFGYAAQKNKEIAQQNLAKTKLDLQTGISKVMADPANENLSAKDLVSKAMANQDPDLLNGVGKNEIQNYLTDATAQIQEKLNVKKAQVAKINTVNNSVDLMNQLRNHVTAGTLNVAGAENLYEASVKPTLQKNTDAKSFAKLDREFRSSIRLDAIKGLDAADAHKTLMTQDYQNEMTASDYQTATQYVKTKHASTVTAMANMTNLQVKLGKDVLNGSFTPNELNVILAQNQDVNSAGLINTVHTFSAIKNMTVPELKEILQPPTKQKDANGNPLPINMMRSQVQQDDNFKQLIQTRIDSVRSQSQKNLVSFAESNGELKPLVGLDSSPIALKTAISNRIVEVANLQNKYQTKAKTIFTQDEVTNFKSAFHSSQNKGRILNSISQVLPAGQYGQADDILYDGAGADMYSIKHGAINFANESYRGSQIIQSKGAAPLSTDQQSMVLSEIQKVLPVTNTKLNNSLMNQISNVIAARGINAKDLKSSEVDKLIQESTGSVMYPQHSIFGVFGKSAYILAPDKDKASILSSIGKYKGKWATENELPLFSKVSGGVNMLDLHTSNGDKVDLKHLARHTILKNITPTMYQMVYSDYTGQTSTLYDKNGKPVIIDASKIDQDDVDNFHKTFGTVGGSGISRLKEPQATTSNSIAEGGKND